MSNLKRIIIGIDPGLQVTGYGVIWSQGSKKGCITFGQIKTNATNSLNFRLCQIEQKLRDLILTHQTHEVSIEQVFTLRNHKAALKLGKHVVQLLLRQLLAHYLFRNIVLAKLNRQWLAMALLLNHKFNTWFIYYYN